MIKNGTANKIVDEPKKVESNVVRGWTATKLTKNLNLIKININTKKEKTKLKCT